MSTDPADRTADTGEKAPFSDPGARATDAVAVEAVLGRTANGRWVVSVGLPAWTLPRLTPAARECLGRLPARQPVESATGLPLWLPRLGVTVLPHALVGGGWLCTLVGADAPGSHVARLPIGIFIVHDLEIVTAVEVSSTRPVQAGLSAEEFRDAWAVRLAAVDPRYHVGTALLATLDLDTLTVTADGLARRRSGLRTASAFRNACVRLCASGFLVALDDAAAPAGAAGPATPAVGGAGDGVRYGLRLPRPGWPR